MLAKIFSRAQAGVDAPAVTVEVHQSNGPAVYGGRAHRMCALGKAAGMPSTDIYAC